MKAMMAIAMAVAMITACTLSDERAEHVLRAHGFDPVALTGYDMFACADDDWWNQGFVGISPLGTRVRGVVCCGALKSCTVRLNGW